MTDTLVSVHVIFRHGDRTPDESAIYPKDPHKGFDYSPYGYGQLTNDGKRRSYRLGQSLRKRYGNILEDLYKSEQLDAWSSDVDRTKMTLQLVLAALFPPTNEQVWHDSIMWQPIPYNCIPKQDDKMFLAVSLDKRAVDEYNNHVQESGRKVMESYADLLNYIEHHSGWRIKSPRSVLNLLCTLTIQQQLGLKLPGWTDKVWPHQIKELALQEFELISATTRLQSLTIGRLLQKIVKDSLMEVRNLSNCKMHLYSAHDITLGMILKFLNVFDWRQPDYCSNIAIELHQIDKVYGFRIKYQFCEDEEVKLMEIPDVGNFWPIEDFVEKHREILENSPYDEDK